MFIPVGRGKGTDEQIWGEVKEASLEVAPTTSSQVPLTEMQSRGPPGGWRTQSSSRPREKRKLSLCFMGLN